MNHPLREVMDRLAAEQAPVPVAPDTYARARRAHRRGVTLRVGAATGLAAAALLAAVPALDRAEAPSPPAAGDRAPAMPSELHPVPEGLATYDESGYSWHEDVRADSLAIGPTAAVFPVGGAVMAVSAVDGTYRGLELPGFDEDNWFRFHDGQATLSPEGTRLAWGWSSDVIDGPRGTGVESGLRIADLRTGDVTDVEIPSRNGVFAHGFGWSPDGRWLAYGFDVATNGDGQVFGGKNFQIGRLDTTTGRTVVTRLQSTDSAPAVSNDGRVAVNGGGYNAIWTPGGSPEVRIYEGPFDSVAWSPGGRTALASSRGQLAIGDGRGYQPQLSRGGQDLGRTRVLGWPDESGFIVLDEGASTLNRVTADLESIEVLVRADRIADLHQVSVAVDLLTEPPRDMPPPDWPTDWGSVAWRGALAVGALLAAVALVVTLRRRG